MYYYYLYHSAYPRPTSIQMAGLIRSVVPTWEPNSLSPPECHNPFLEKPSKGFMRTGGEKNYLYYINGRREVFLSGLQRPEHLSQRFPAYYRKEDGILVDVWSDVPIRFRKVLYPEWPFLIS